MAGPANASIPAASDPKRRGGSRIRVILKKELVETFRDRRTLFAVVISPLLITPLLLGMIGAVVRRQVRQEQAETVAVGIIGQTRAPSVREALKGAPNLRIEEVTREEAEQRIRDRRLRAAVLLPPDTENLMREEREVPVQILVDAGSDRSTGAARRLRELFTERGRRLVAQRLMERGLPSELASPFAVAEKPIASGGTNATLMLAAFLPYVLVLSGILGSVYAANDMVAGEKERGTLEALLVSPASRRDLVAGKFLATAVVSLVSSMLAVIGLLLPFYVRLPGLEWLSSAPLKLTALGVLLLFLVQIPIAVLGAGVLLAISTFSRNQKEAQTYLGPVMIVTTVLAMLSMLIRTEASLPLALVPILNAAMALKQALAGSVDVRFVLLAFAASIVYALLAMAVATWLFEREEVLLKA